MNGTERFFLYVHNCTNNAVSKFFFYSWSNHCFWLLTLRFRLSFSFVGMVHPLNIFWVISSKSLPLDEASKLAIPLANLSIFRSSLLLLMGLFSTVTSESPLMDVFVDTSTQSWLSETLFRSIKREKTRRNKMNGIFFWIIGSQQWQFALVTIFVCCWLRLLLFNWLFPDWVIRKPLLGLSENIRHGILLLSMKQKISFLLKNTFIIQFANWPHTGIVN